MRISTRRLSVLLLVAMTALTLGACGDDGGDGEAADDATTTTEAADAGPVEVTAVDYGYQGLPDSVEAGTKFTFANSSTAELHEFVAMRIPDEEKRPVSELAALPPEETDAIFGGQEPATVLVTPPGGEMIPAVGDGTISEAGRYAIVCFIPVGADPQEYMQRMQESQGGPPQGSDDDGPPHITKGMFAELTVTGSDKSAGGGVG